MGTLHPYPFLLRLVDELSGLVGQRAGFALHHVPDVDLAADEGFYGGFRPLVVDVARVAAPLALIVERTGRQNALLVERDGDGAEACAGGAHGEDHIVVFHAFLCVHPHSIILHRILRQSHSFLQLPFAAV